ncbi:MAG: hypothetical protein HFH93_06995 [Lachnospiraceae bacterium]|nr:hypothetical protein [Lachnospiraceae bacterium]
MEVAGMDRKTTGIVAYLTIVGWFVAYFVGDREDAKFHLNQALVVHMTFIVLSILARIPIVGWFVWILNAVVFVIGVLGIIYAIQDQDKEVPLLGIIKLLK